MTDIQMSIHSHLVRYLTSLHLEVTWISSAINGDRLIELLRIQWLIFICFHCHCHMSLIPSKLAKEKKFIFVEILTAIQNGTMNEKFNLFWHEWIINLIMPIAREVEGKFSISFRSVKSRFITLYADLSEGMASINPNWSIRIVFGT